MNKLLTAVLLSSVITLSVQAQKAEEYYVKHVEFPPNATLEQKVDMAARLIPTPQQLSWQQMELTAFLHFGINTFTGREWGDGKEDPALFNPSELDAEQWVRSLKDAGFKMVLLTAKHHDGFCLWPTTTTKHSVASSPWKNGQGDVVKELRKACDKYGMKFGVYLSPWDRNAECYGDSPRYNEFFIRQLTELLTNYGEVHEVWFDGANGEGPNGKKQVYDWDAFYKTIQRLQPKAVMAIMGDDVRWVGNEKGLGRETEWNATVLTPGIYARSAENNKRLGVFSKAADLGSRKMLEKATELFWYPSEVDVSIRPGWFYHPEEDGRVKTVDELTDLYYRSVGHNATLLLNFPVDRDGLIHPTDSANAVNFHKNIQKQLEKNLLAGLSPKASDERGKAFSAKAVTDNDYDTYWATNDDVTSATIEFDLPQPEKINRMMLQEYIPLGQRVKSFVVEYNQEGEWLPVKLNEETTTVGYKRLLRFETITTDKLRVRFTDSRACLCINNIEAFYAGATSDTYPAKAEELKSFPFTLSGVDTEEAQKCMDKNDQTACFVNGNTLLIDLGEERTITSFHYLPDQSEYNKGVIAAYEISVGMDSNAVNQVVAKDEFSNIKNNPILQSVYFTPLKARYVQLKATRMIHDGEPLGLAEIGIQ